MKHQGNVILELIRAKGLNQRQFAQKVGVEENTISTNLSKPKLSLRILRVYANALGMTYEELEFNFGSTSKNPESSSDFYKALLTEKDARIEEYKERLKEKDKLILSLEEKLLACEKQNKITTPNHPILYHQQVNET